MFMPNEELVFSNEVRKEELEPSADIVFVVEQSKCNQRIAGDLNTIIQRLEQALQSEGKYSLFFVSFTLILSFYIF